MMQHHTIENTLEKTVDNVDEEKNNSFQKTDNWSLT
jgi:hypothetical protein